MGKDRNCPRTKGNQKPSSSRRSAELLGGTSGFVGFSGLSDLGYVPAAAQGNLDDDSQISAEFRVILRKMSKKDTTTKIKGLQEFEGLCAAEDIESIKSALPYWPRIYCKLSIDSERRVREAVHSAHSVLVAQIGKQLAPYLKAIMPCWLMAMNDPYTAAANAATKSFQVAFMEEKRPGVMFFCTEEIIDCIYDNLFIQTAQTLADSKTSSRDEQENKYIRIVYCSLKGLCLFLKLTANSEATGIRIDDQNSEATGTRINDQNSEATGTRINKMEYLFTEEKFWKLAKHKSSLVQSAWFDTIHSFCDYDCDILKAFVPQLVKSVFASLDCPDPFVLPHVWIAFLHICVRIPECWDQCGSLTSVISRLLSVIQDGGRGTSEELCPHLLPILSIIPVDSLTGPNEFYSEFFSSFMTCLRKEKTMLNKRERCAWVVALYECLRFVSKKECHNEELWNVLIKNQVVEPLVASFADCSQMAHCNLYEEVGKLLAFWDTVPEGGNSAVPESDNSVHSGKLKLFWNLFLPYCNGWVKEDSKENLVKLRQCLSALRYSDSVTTIRLRGVRFDDDFVAPNTQASVKVSSSLPVFVSPLILTSFETFLGTRSANVFELFAFLLSNFASDLTYSLLTDGEAENASLLKKLFLEETILPLWDNSEAPIETSVDIFFTVYVQIEPEFQKHLLMNLKPTVTVGALKVLTEKLAKSCQEDTVAALWLKSSPLGCRLVKCLHRLVTIALTEHSLLSPKINKEFGHLVEIAEFVFGNGNVFSLEYLGQMIQSLEVILNQPHVISPHSQDQLLEVISKLVTLHIESSSGWMVEGLGDLLKAMFRHMFCDSEDVRSRVERCILNGLECWIKKTHKKTSASLFSDQMGLLLFLLTESKNMILNPVSSFSTVVKVEQFLESVLLMLFKNYSWEEDCDIILDHSVIQASLEIVFPSELEWNTLEGNLSALYAAPTILEGLLICREFPLPKTTGEPPTWDQSYIRVCLFVGRLLVSLCAFSAEDAESRFEELSLGKFLRLAVLVLHGASHSYSLLRMKTSLNTNAVSTDIQEGTEQLIATTKKLLSLMNSGNKKHLIKCLTERCSFGSILWCVTFKRSLTDWVDTPVEASKLLEDVDESRLGFTETKQILLSSLDDVGLLRVLTEETARLLAYTDDPFSALPSLCLLMSALENVRENDAASEVIIKESVHAVFAILVKWRDSASNIFLFASDLKGVPWEEVSLMVSIIRLLTVIVRRFSLLLLHSHWDVTLCSLSAWTQSLLEASKHPEADTVVAMFAVACCDCARAISELIRSLSEDSERLSDYPPTLMEEWLEFFAPAVCHPLLMKFIDCNSFYQNSRSIILYRLCQSLAGVVSVMAKSTLKDVSLPPLLNADDVDAPLQLPENLQSFLNHLSPSLLSYHPPCQYAAYNVLDTVLPIIMESWEKNEMGLSDKEDLPQRPLPSTLMSIIEKAGLFVSLALEPQEMGSCCEIVPHTSIHAHTAGYLLSWMLALSAISQAAEQNQQLYSSFIRESGLLLPLLSVLFKLMPSDPQLDKKHFSKASSFNYKFLVTPRDKISSEMISGFAVHLYIHCLMRLPAAVRSWFTNLDRATQQTVDKYTTAHISPILIANELNIINESTVKFDNMMIKCRPGAREVVAIYTIDEATMELVLRMASNHPLSTIVLEDQKRVGLNTMLSHRNTPLLNSLEFWKKNVDQKFDGIEECFICYYVLHGTNHQIPKLLCRTCKKKFHSACLYKWFSTSNNSTCPICRSLF